LLPTPFLDIDNLVANGGNERGLLGLAFHPDYWNNGYFYVNYTATNGATIIRRFQAAPANSDVVDPATGVTLMAIGQPYNNHNGGMLAFGHDGYLYIGMGDGGSGLDPDGNGQNLESLLGKMLRIDVDNPAPGQNYGIPPTNPLVGKPGRDEIYHWGLRNPWRWSFDRATGDMYIGDVGQSDREEIDYVPDGVGGRNFGWRCLEGTMCTGLGGCLCTSPLLTPPAHWYSHGATTGASINGGYVYRGCAIPFLSGTYFFSDYVTGQCWSATIDPITGKLTDVVDRTSTLGSTAAGLASFGEDAHGEIYIIDRDEGTLHKIVGGGGGVSLQMVGTAAIGTPSQFNLVSSGNANKAYVFGLSTGNRPGINLPDGRVIPLRDDPLLHAALAVPNNGIYNPYGILDPMAASASVSVSIPLFPALIGEDFWVTFIVLDPSAPSGIADISCAVRMTIH
jgi:hypothetical protein